MCWTSCTMINDLNCDNFAQAVREYRCSHEVITAVANLYLRQQIMIGYILNRLWVDNYKI